MLPELSVIKLLCCYEQWCNYEDKLAVQDLPKELQPVYRVVDSHHRSNPGVDLSMADLANYFFANNPGDREFYNKLFDQLVSLEVSDQSTLELLNSLRRNKVLQELSLLSYEVTQGRKEFHLVGELLTKLDGLSHSTTENGEEEITIVSDDLEVLLNETYHKPGLRWRLDALNKMMGSLRKGDFGFLFARPETGKTTFLASEVSYFASQLGEDECGIWFNNEEEGQKVKLRIIQAHFGVPLEELMVNLPQYRERYMEEIGSRLLFIDEPSLTKAQIERFCDRKKPRFIVFDQLDKVLGFNDDRDDLKLGAIYQWARELAKLYGPVIGVTQSNGEGEGVRWLNMNHVANARTAKQAEADWILGIGKDNNAGFDAVRFLHLSKNKLQGDPDTDATKRHGKEQVLIEPYLARYKDIERR